MVRVLNKTPEASGSLRPDGSRRGRLRVCATTPAPRQRRHYPQAPLVLCSAVALLAAVGTQAQPPGRAGAPYWRFVGAEPGRSGPVVKGAPFSADVTTETTMVLPDGNRIHQVSKLRFYRDSEGRTRREQSLNNLGSLASNTNLPTVIFISDPVAGANYALSPASKTATQSPAGGRGLGGNRGGRMRGGPPPGEERNVKTESLGSKTVEGVTAEGTRTTITIPAGQEGNEKPIETVIESWYVRELQMVVLSRRSDPRTGETVMHYSNIVRGEPAHSLFEVPADYKITQGRGPRPGAK